MDWWVLLCSFALGVATWALYYIVERLRNVR